MPKFDSLHIFALWMTVALLLALQHVCYADASSASLTVTVSDSSGAVIPQAQVALRNTETNQEQRSISGKTGSTTFPFLRPGHYALTVSKGNFSDITVDHILLNVGDEKQLNLVLKVGTTTQNITVDGSGPTINTTDGSVSTVIDRQFVANIPLNGRSFQDLISMTPGVVTQSPQSPDQASGFNGDFSVNGQRTESNYYTVDGVSGNINAGNGYGGEGGPNQAGGLAAATALGTTQSLISVDALQEFKVQSSTYSAEFGRFPGGQFSLLTRSGTNVFHGTAFDYLRNNFFDANDWFNDHYGASISPLRQNDFGGTFGGPVLVPRAYNGKDKTFLFVSYEGLRLTQPQAASLLYVPDQYMRQQAPAPLQAILNAFPLPNGSDHGNSANPSLAEFTKSYSLPSQIDSTSIRVDHAFSPTLTTFFRAGYTPSFIRTRSLSTLSDTQANTYTYTSGATTQLSTNVNNEFRIGYAKTDTSAASFLDSFGGAQPINLANAMGVTSSPSTSNPEIVLDFTGVGISTLQTSKASNHGRQWNITDKFRGTSGKHQLEFGVDILHIDSPTNPTSPVIYAEFATSQSVLANSLDYTYLSKSLGATPRFIESSAFFQDEWRTRPDLSISAGLRWEIDPPPTEAHGNNAYVLLGTLSDPNTLTLAPRGTPLWRTSWFNFAPRLGVAWTANKRPDRETVIRGGAGVFFDTDNQRAGAAFAGIGFTAANQPSVASLPITPEQLSFTPSVSPPFTAVTIYSFPQHLQLPYTLQWNISLEQAMGKSQALTLSYVGSNGRRLLVSPESYLTSLNPNYGYVIFVNNGSTSNYQALQAKFQRSLNRGLQALISYTWSHSLDYGSNADTLPVTRGNSDFDVRNNFQAALSWNLPVTRYRRFVNTLLEDWGIDARVMARSGFPITLEGEDVVDPATGGRYYSEVDVVKNVPVYLYGGQYPGGRALNPLAFTYPASGEIGNAPRNFLRGFDAGQVNMAMRREFRIHENTILQFRGEAFNLFNRPNFGFLDPYLGDTTFGRATQMLNQSLGTVSSLYQQGGARSMQFALKLLF